MGDSSHVEVVFGFAVAVGKLQRTKGIRGASRGAGSRASHSARLVAAYPGPKSNVSAEKESQQQ